MYADLTYANAYFATRLHTEAWDDASTADKTKALTMATRDIDRLSFSLAKTDPEQANEFPRGDETTVPEDIQIACCEIAISRLDGLDPDSESQNATVTTEAFGPVRASYQRDGVPEHILARIVSATAWTYLRPYLSDAQNIRIDRVS